MRLVLQTSPDPALRATLFAAIDAYNDAATGRPEPVQHLSIVLRDNTGAVEGGLVGVSYYDWLIVEMLFVPERLHGRGMGRRLMVAAEAVAARRGCIGVWLDTTSTNARRFYEGLGYDVFATLPDQPRGHARWWMARRDPTAGEISGLDVQEVLDADAAVAIGRALHMEGDRLFGPDAAQATLAIAAEAQDGRSLGGLWMVARRDWMFLDLFILDAEARRQGAGTRILAMAEAAAQARGCVGVWLDSYGFQAPGFYRRQGYEEYGVLAESPAPFGRHFLRKIF